MTPQQMIDAGIRALQSADEGQLSHIAAAAVANAWAALARETHRTTAGANEQATEVPTEGCDCHKPAASAYPGSRRHNATCDCTACMQAVRDAIEADRRDR